MKIKPSPATVSALIAGSLFFIATGQFIRAQNQEPQPPLEQQLKETEAEFRKSDAALNELFQKVLSTLPPNGREQLKNAQRAWVKSRNHSAATEESTSESHVSALADHDVAVPDPKAGDDILVFRYLKRQTEDRIEELKKNYAAAEIETPAGQFEKIRDKSPDGKFAMRVSCSSEPPDPENIEADLITGVQLISLPTKKPVMQLPQDYNGNAPALIWSQDSKWLAFSIADGPRVSDAHVYHNSGDYFIELRTEDLRVDVKGDVRNEYVYARRWVKPGVLLLEQNDILRGDGDANRRFTVSFDEKTGKFRILSNTKIASTVTE